MSIRLSFSTAGLFPRSSIEALKLIDKAGFFHAELMSQCREETKPEFAKKIKNEVKLKVGSIHFPLVFFSTFYNPYPGMIRETREMVDDLSELSGLVGAEVIVIHPPYFGNKIIDKIFHDPVLDNMRYLCEKSEEKGVKVALENSPKGKGGESPSDLLNVIREVNHRNIFPMVDTTEAVEGGQNPVEMLQELNVVHIHASDHKGDAKHILPGKGELDWVKIISLLKEKNFSGLFTVEPAYRYLLEEPLEKMKEILRFLENL